MDSSTDSSPPDSSLESINSGADPFSQLPTNESKNINNGLAAKDAESLFLFADIADEHGALRVSVDPKYLQTPRAQQAPVMIQQASVVTQPSRLNAIYAAEFRRLELELQAKYPHTPSYVTEGNVATLSLVSVSTGSEAIFESALEYTHFAGPAK